jgi:hypothetical protein
MRGFAEAARRAHPRSTLARRTSTPHSSQVDFALHLQRTVGNVAFRQLLQRDPTQGWDLNDEHKKFTRTHHKNPNRTVKQRGMELRNVLLQGLKHGFTGTETGAAKGSAGDSVEDAAGKAVVWMPSAFKPKDATEVLLHLHGFGSGYRELEKGKTDYAHVLDSGQTRDEDLYQLPDQLAASMKTPGRQVIAVLPQGRSRGSGSMFGDIASNPTRYLDEVFGALKTQNVIADAPSDYHVVVSGHSGSGPEVMQATAALEKKGLSLGGLSEVVLFDAINGSNELEAVKDWLRPHIQSDVGELGKQASHTEDEMKTFYSGKPRFRGYFTHGFYESMYGDGSGQLRQWLTSEIQSRGKKLDKTALKWLDWQYKVFGPLGPQPTQADPYGPHEHLLATQNDAAKAGLLDEILDLGAGPPP